jgi:hypothetical protein
MNFKVDAFRGSQTDAVNKRIIVNGDRADLERVERFIASHIYPLVVNLDLVTRVVVRPRLGAIKVAAIRTTVFTI